MEIPKLVFIVPYRNRPYQKTHFTIYMEYILEDIPKTDYEIYFSHQCDTRSFNRGGMKNIGFLAIKDKYPDNYKNITFVFNDIDTIPCEKNILNYYTKHGIVKHFYGFKFALGGIFSITGQDFEKCNGFPNYWGWGLEDNNINKRVLNNNIIIDRSVFYPIGSEEIMQCMDKPIRLINDKESTKIFTNEGMKDIKNLEYEISGNLINVSNFTTLEDWNLKEFYTRDISKKGAHKTYKNALEKVNPNNPNNSNNPHNTYNTNRIRNLRKMF